MNRESTPIHRMYLHIARGNEQHVYTQACVYLIKSSLLGLDDHRKFQMLLFILQWRVMICRPDLCHLVSSLNRSGACPRETHLDIAVQYFDYLKQVPDPQICIDNRPMMFNRTKADLNKLIPDFMKDYPEAIEEVDPSFLLSFGPVLQTTILVDSDHRHDQKTRRSLTVWIAFVGSTPVA